MTAVLQEILRIERDDTGLIGLGNIGEYGVDHADQHTVFVRVTSVFDDWNNVGAFLGHIDQIATGAVREFNGVDQTFWTDHIGDVRYGGAGRSAQVQHFRAWWHVDFVNTAQNGSGQL